MFHTTVKRTARAAKDELGNKIRRARRAEAQRRRTPGDLTQRHALSRQSETKADETQKIFGVHLNNKIIRLANV